MHHCIDWEPPSGDLIGISGTVIDVTKSPRPIPAPHDAQARLKRNQRTSTVEVMMRRKIYIKPRPEDTYTCTGKYVPTSDSDSERDIFQTPSQA